MEALGLLVVFFAVLTLMGLGIRGYGPSTMHRHPQPVVGQCVEAILYPVLDIPAAVAVDRSVTGHITAVAADGTMTVREWDTGDEHRCLATGFSLVPPRQAQVMYDLRLEEDLKDIRNGPTRAIH